MLFPLVDLTDCAMADDEARDLDGEVADMMEDDSAADVEPLKALSKKAAPHSTADPVAKTKEPSPVVHVPPALQATVDELDANSFAMASAPAGTSLKSQAAVKARGKVAFDLNSLPEVDAHRVVPQNFRPEVHAAYMRVPEVALPQRPSAGAANYTILNGGATIEVQLAGKAFHVVKCADSTAPATGTGHHPWSGEGNLEGAWERALKAVGLESWPPCG